MRRKDPEALNHWASDEEHINLSKTWKEADQIEHRDLGSFRYSRRKLLLVVGLANLELRRVPIFETLDAVSAFRDSALPWCNHDRSRCLWLWVWTRLWLLFCWCQTWWRRWTAKIQDRYQIMRNEHFVNAIHEFPEITVTTYLKVKLFERSWQQSLVR